MGFVPDIKEGFNMKQRKSMKKIAAVMLVVALMVANVCPVFAATKHKVTFRYGLNVSEVMVDHGANAVLPTNTYVPGYVFLGWVGDATNVTEDRLILGAYSKVDTPAANDSASSATSKTYRVKFIDGLTGANYYNQTVSDGADANPPEVPHHSGWHFDHYVGDYQKVHSDVTITAIYEEDWDWIDDPWDQWWWYYSTDDPDFYQEYWWM